MSFKTTFLEWFEYGRHAIFTTYSDQLLKMKTIRKIIVFLFSILFVCSPWAQAIYDANGAYKGYSQTSPSGVTNVYNAQGQNTQSFQTDNGQTNFYTPQGQYQGTSTAPIVTSPNTMINTPRQAPQAPSIKGW